MKKILYLPAVAGLLCALSAHAQMTVDEMLQLDEGFELFTEETFDGNGRTCGTCHLPEEQYTIAPSDIRKLSGDALDKVLASNVPGLENPTLVMELGLFNIEGGPPPEDDALDCDYEMECHGPVFRGSMTVGPFALTTGAPGVPGLPDPALGWSANGSPGGFFHHGVLDPDADASTRAFANGAIAQHFSLCLDRSLPNCFRFATDEELDAMDAFQNWLGRRNEFDIGIMAFRNRHVEAGRALYMSNEASCNVCHGNGGSQFLGGANGNINQHSDVDEERHRLTEETGVFIPEDEGIAVDPPGPQPLSAGAFNIQPVIEAVRKGEVFFHNSAVVAGRNGYRRGSHRAGIEQASTFYFREPFISSDIHTALQGLLGGGGGDGTGNLHLDSLEEFKAFGGKNAVNEMGAFMRSLAVFHSIVDCERLVQETIDRMVAGVSPDLPAQHCGFNLEDVTEVLQGAQVRGLYRGVGYRAKALRKKLRRAVYRHDYHGLVDLLSDLERLRNSVATTPELP